MIEPEEMARILPRTEYFKVLPFVHLAEKLGCKYLTRYASGHKSWKCIYSKQKPARVLFTIDCRIDRWTIKACLFHIDKYRKHVEKSSDAIRERILSAYDCRKCNSRCKGGCEFTLNGMKHSKCVGLSFYFSDLENQDMKNLIKLIMLEAKF